MAKADPIFATLEAQRRAAAKIEELKYLVELSPDPDGTLWEKFSETIDAEHDATDDVCATLPTTCAGAQALSRFIRERLVAGELNLNTLQPDLILQAVSSLERFLAAATLPQLREEFSQAENSTNFRT